MNEEIKEILEALRDSIDDTGTDKVNFINWVDKIEDYITNLEEIVMRIETPLHRGQINGVELVNKFYRNYKDYKSRNEKAIEFLEHFDSGQQCEHTKDLAIIVENILQGEDKDVNITN